MFKTVFKKPSRFFFPDACRIAAYLGASMATKRRGNCAQNWAQWQTSVRFVELNPSSRPWALVGTLVVFAGLSKQLLDNIPMLCFTDRELPPPIRIAVELLLKGRMAGATRYWL
jgi:hypothetical protein